MPLDGNQKFIILANGISERNFAQEAICTQSYNGHAGEVYTRKCVDGVFGLWLKIITDSDLYARYNGDWDNMPNGFWISHSDNPHSPLGADGYWWLVNCEKNISVNNYYQMAYRVSATQSGHITRHRLGTSSGWQSWYDPK